MVLKAQTYFLNSLIMHLLYICLHDRRWIFKNISDRIGQESRNHEHNLKFEFMTNTKKYWNREIERIDKNTLHMLIKSYY